MKNWYKFINSLSQVVYVTKPATEYKTVLPLRILLYKPKLNKSMPLHKIKYLSENNNRICYRIYPIQILFEQQWL